MPKAIVAKAQDTISDFFLLSDSQEPLNALFLHGLWGEIDAERPIKVGKRPNNDGETAH